MLALIGEVGELAECLQWRSAEECSGGLSGFSADQREHVGQELADVLLYTLRLADRCHVDLPAAIWAKLKLNARKYPAHLAKGSSAKYDAYSPDTGVTKANQRQGRCCRCPPDQPWLPSTIQEVRDALRKFVEARDWGQYHLPRNLVLALTGEVGELSELFQFQPEEACTPGLPQWSSENTESLCQELADVMIYLIRLSDVCGIDLPAATMQKIAINEKKYPPARVKGRWEKYSSYNSSTVSIYLMACGVLSLSGMIIFNWWRVKRF